ncbi:CBS domain-containing protein [Nitrospira sp. Nam74]
MARAESGASRLLREVMTTRVTTLLPTDTVQSAAQRMKALNVGSIPICECNQLVGMLTDRDIVVRVIADRHNPETKQIQDAMTRQVDYCYEDQDVDEAAQVMQDRQIRRLPIIDRDNQLVGIVSLGDLAVKTNEEKTMAQALEQISLPAEPRRQVG